MRGVKPEFDLSQDSDPGHHPSKHSNTTELQQQMGKIETHQTSSNLQQLVEYRTQISTLRPCILLLMHYIK